MPGSIAAQPSKLKVYAYLNPFFMAMVLGTK